MLTREYLMLGKLLSQICQITSLTDINYTHKGEIEYGLKPLEKKRRMTGIVQLLLLTNRYW